MCTTLVSDGASRRLNLAHHPSVPACIAFISPFHVLLRDADPSPSSHNVCGPHAAPDLFRVLLRPRGSHNPHAAASAGTHRVLKEGLPGATGPLILRYLRTHLQDGDASAPVATVERIFDLWDAPSVVVDTHRWKRYYNEEAIVKRCVDTGDNALLFRELSNTIGWMTHLTYSKQARRLSLQRIRAAALVADRADVVEWLNDEDRNVNEANQTLTRFPTPLNPRVASAPKWRARVVMEAIVALDDSATFDMLRFLLRGCAFQHKPEQALRRCVHRAWEVAASCGRVDVLTWLYETYEAAVVEILPAINRSAVVLAVRHGHAPVLTWLESTFGSSALEVIRSYEMKGPVGRGHLDVVHWMTQRALGVMPVGAAFLAVAKRDVAMLDTVLTILRSSSSSTPCIVRRHAFALADFAKATDQPEAMLCLVQQGCVFPISFLLDAIARRDFGAVECILDHLDNLHAPESIVYLVSRLIQTDDAHVLAMVLTRLPNHVLLQRELHASVLLWVVDPNVSTETVQLLLRTSSIGDIVTVLVRLALLGDSARVETVIALVNRPLPPDILGFVHRVMTEALGPVASLARTYKPWCRWGHPIPDAHLMETMTQWTESASREDVHDLALQLLPLEAPTALERVLVADGTRAVAHSDREFLSLCLSQRYSTHAIQRDRIAAIMQHREHQEQQQIQERIQSMY